MAWNLVASTSAPASQTWTPTIDTTGANLIVAVVCGQAPLSFGDDQGNTYTLAVSSVDDISALTALFYCYNPNVSTSHHFDGNESYRAISVAAFSGAGPSPLDAVAQANSDEQGVLTIQAGSITPSANGELVIAGMGGGKDFASVSVDSGFTLASTEPGVSGSTYGSALAYSVQTSAATVDPTWTRSAAGESWAVIASFRSSAPSVYSYSASGSVSIYGAGLSSSAAHYAHSTSGSIALTGAANTASSTRYGYVATGSVNASGAANTSTFVRCAYTGSGAFNVSGASTANYGSTYHYSSVGDVAVRGAAATASTTRSTYVVFGDVSVLGSAAYSTTAKYAYAASGSISTSGTAVTSFTPLDHNVFSYIARGSVVLSGSTESDYTARFAYSSVGSVVVGGQAVTRSATRYAYSSSVAVLIQGAAITAAGLLALPLDPHYLVTIPTRKYNYTDSRNFTFTLPMRRWEIEL